MQTANPYSTQHAVELADLWVREHKKVTPDLCDHYAALLFGWGHSGEVTARTHWDHIPSSYKMDKPVTGCLAFYGHGTGAGHVALICASHDPKNVVIATPDLPRAGLWTHQLVTAPTHEWGLPLLGYSKPLFPRGTAPVHSPVYKV